jgi:prevent-host-death family protein
MREIGSYELKTHLAEILDAVEQGESIVVTRHGRPVARILPDTEAERERASQAVEALIRFPRTPLPKGVTLRTLIEEGRR